MCHCASSSPSRSLINLSRSVFIYLFIQLLIRRVWYSRESGQQLDIEILVIEFWRVQEFYSSLTCLPYCEAGSLHRRAFMVFFMDEACSVGKRWGSGGTGDMDLHPATRESSYDGGRGRLCVVECQFSSHTGGVDSYIVGIGCYHCAPMFDGDHWSSEDYKQ
nr:uncharacterized protein LOC112211330 [Halyomorpha halys]